MSGGPDEPIAIADGDADSAQIARFERDRRQLIRRGLGIGGAVVAASSIPLLLSVRDAFAFGDADRSVLADAIRVERIAALSYDTLLAQGRTSRHVAGIIELLRSHERSHADALTTALSQLAQAPPAAPTAKDIAGVVKGIADVRTESDVLNFAIELETALVGTYLEAHRTFYDAKLLQLSATIIGSEGQHLVLLRQAANRAAIPNALESAGPG